MEYVSGEILTEEGLKQGFLAFNQQGSRDICSGTPPKKPLVKGLIIPTPVNAHTHIGDTFIRDKHVTLPHNVEKLVAPPHGLKHQLLQSASKQDILHGMKLALDEMINAGITWFCDFREGDLKGVHYLQEALHQKPVSCHIYSRPLKHHFDKSILDSLLNVSYGIGLSSISDWDIHEIIKVAKYVHKKHKSFALHASEVIREDIDLILSLKPSFLIHMTSAKESDLERIGEENIPLVLCPRSNAFFKLKTSYDLMKKHNLTIMLGSDNAMLHSLNILEDVLFLRKHAPYFTLEELLKMCTYTPRKVLNLDDCIGGQNLYRNFVVLERETLQLLYRSPVI